MKHVFLNQSWINQFLIEAIIEEKQLPLEDCIILTNRNFDSQSYSNTKLKTYAIRKIPLKGWKNELFAIYRTFTFHKWIKAITGNSKFVFYAPHLIALSFRLIHCHSLCRETRLLEEGILSLRSIDYLKKRFPKLENPAFFKIAGSIGWLKKTHKTGAMDLEIRSGYHLLKGAFAYIPERINMRQKVVEVLANYRSENAYKVIFSLPPYVNGVLAMPLADYLRKLKELIEFLNRSTSEVIYYKFHPSDSQIVRQESMKLFDAYPERYKLLEDDNPLETIMYFEKPMVITYNSSIATYAVEFDCTLKLVSKWFLSSLPYLNFPHYDLSPFYIEKK